MAAFIEGVVAGYGIAVPVGGIAVLIIDLGMRRGLLPAMAAGLGAATADLFYALLAMAAGTAIAAWLEPVRVPLRVISAVVLMAIAAFVMVRALAHHRRGAEPEEPDRPRRLRRTFGRFLGLTLLNPMTVVYFAALILGLREGRLDALGAKAAFVAGAFGASLSWQWLLAAGGTVLRHRLSDTARTLTSLIGSAIIAALAVRILATA